MGRACRAERATFACCSQRRRCADRRKDAADARFTTLCGVITRDEARAAERRLFIRGGVPEASGERVSGSTIEPRLARRRRADQDVQSSLRR